MITLDMGTLIYSSTSLKQSRSSDITRLRLKNIWVDQIKRLNNERGGEYEAFDEFCRGKGIRHIYTTSYKPQQNRIAERRNRTLMEMT